MSLSGICHICHMRPKNSIYAKIVIKSLKIGSKPQKDGELMAKYVVPPRQMSREIILKCCKCGALYVPDGKQKGFLRETDYEPCPICGYSHNSDGQKITLWKYNLIKYFRERGRKEEELDDEPSEESQQYDGPGSTQDDTTCTWYCPGEY